MKRIAHLFVIPVLLLCTLSVAARPLHDPAEAGGFADGDWEAMGAGLPGSVSGLAVYNGELVAVGGFSTESGAPADRIARWTGSAWAPFPGGGADSGISEIIVFRDGLIVAGRFDTIGGVVANGLARWNGSQWSALSGNLFLSVDALAVYRDELIVTGNSAATDARQNIAKWNGTSWTSLGDGLEDSAAALGVHDGSLYAASHLPWPNLDEGIWRWDGSTWSIFEDQLDDTIYALGSHAGQLVAAGWFTSIGGINANHIAAWNGSAWTPLGGGLGNGLPNQRVDVFATYNGGLWAGGYFELAGGAPASHVAYWDGATWTSPGAGADQPVLALATHAGGIIAGGSFETMDGDPVHFIARWQSDPVFHSGFD